MEQMRSRVHKLLEMQRFLAKLLNIYLPLVDTKYWIRWDHNR